MTQSRAVLASSLPGTLATKETLVPFLPAVVVDRVAILTCALVAWRAFLIEPLVAEAVPAGDPEHGGRVCRRARNHLRRSGEVLAHLVAAGLNIAAVAASMGALSIQVVLIVAGP